MPGEITNYADIRESLSLILESKAADRKQQILDSLDDAASNHADLLRTTGHRVMYDEIRRHIGHEIVSVEYGDGVNVAIECETCSEVIVDEDRR